MSSESKGQHVIFIIILISIFFLSYCSIPLPKIVNSTHKISKKAQTRVSLDKKDKTTSKDESLIVKKAVINEPDTIKDLSEEVLVVPLKTKLEELKVETRIDKGEKASFPDIILMNTAAYKKHTKGIVQFAHKNHVEKHSIDCGQCHHDETGTPLDLKINDDAKACIECHKETQKSKGEKLGKKEKIAKYHFEALHANCIGCHKAYNKEKGDPKGKVPAPTSCTKCHLKK
ncbi:cytochrome c3 family protein [Desulfobacula sp.]